MTGRFVPWAGLLDALGESRFAEVRAALDAAHADPADRDAFLLAAAVGPVLRDLVPPDAPAEAVTSYGALLHALYLHWAHGGPVRPIDRERLRPLLAAPPAAPTPEPGACYLQLPERLVWAAPAPGAPHEPLDGCFLLTAAGRARVVAVLGARPEREGFTTIEAEAPLPPPPLTARDDGTAPFAPVLPAGERMGFVSLTSEAELVWLALLAPLAAAG
jgi:hypothetical protein